MSDSKYLDAYLKFNEGVGENYWPSKLRMMGVEKYDPMYVSSHLFVIYFPGKTHEDFIAWRHHRLQNGWQDDIYWMSEAEFKYHWPMLAGLLTWTEV
jgi:hypothetical protein